MKTEQNNKTETTKAETTKAENVYEDISSMDKKAIREEYKSLMYSADDYMSKTEYQILRCLVQGGKIINDERDEKKRVYHYYMETPNGRQTSIRNENGFWYIMDFAKRIGAVLSEKDKIKTWTIPNNSERLPYAKRLVLLHENKK